MITDLESYKEDMFEHFLSQEKQFAETEDDTQLMRIWADYLISRLYLANVPVEET